MRYKYYHLVPSRHGPDVENEKGHLVLSRQGRGLWTVVMRCGVCSDCIESAC